MSAFPHLSPPATSVLASIPCQPICLASDMLAAVRRRALAHPGAAGLLDVIITAGAAEKGTCFAAWERQDGQPLAMAQTLRGLEYALSVVLQHRAEQLAAHVTAAATL